MLNSGTRCLLATTMASIIHVMDSCTFHYYRPMQAIQSATECLLTLRGKGEKKRKFDWTPEERAECKLVLASAEHEIRALPWLRDAITDRRAHAERHNPQCMTCPRHCPVLSPHNPPWMTCPWPCRILSPCSQQCITHSSYVSVQYLPWVACCTRLHTATQAYNTTAYSTREYSTT